MSALQVLAFGELSGATWGVCWIGDGSRPARLAVRTGSASAVLEVNPERPGDDVWELAGDEASLLFHPEGHEVSSRDPEGQIEREDQLCRVSGRLRIESEATEVDCLGWRSSVQAESVLKRFDSVRFLAAWLAPGAGFSLTAVRPRKARDHEADALAAAVTEEPSRRVADPRLSTTYADDGRPARAGLELWLEAEAPENAEEESPLQYTRRAAGEAVGPDLDWEARGVALHAALLRWHSQGRDGPGVYVLGRRR